jgi:hypothetical protein
MTKDEDALNAFTGVLQRLETMYDTGFFWGLPQADFQWGLLWQAQTQPRRRLGFPSWSWAGWRCPMWPSYPRETTKLNQFPVWLHVQRVHASVLVDVFSIEDPLLVARDVEILSNDDALTNVAMSAATGAAFDIELYPQAQDNGYLFLEVITLDFQPEYGQRILNKKHQGEHEIFVFPLRGIRCGLQIRSKASQVKMGSRHTRFWHGTVVAGWSIIIYCWCISRMVWQFVAP